MRNQVTRLKALMYAVSMTLAILTVIVTGCKGAWPSELAAEAEKPFYKDKVATFRIVMEPEDWEFTLENAFDKRYVVADIFFNDEHIPYVGVRPKGNSTLGQPIGYGSPRIPLTIDFNMFNRTRTFYGMKKVYLSNGWSDPTHIREALAYELFDQMGIPTPRANHVDVWVNDTHLGLYTMVEGIDTSFLARNFDSPYGNLYKPALSAAKLDWTEADAARALNTGPYAAKYDDYEPDLYADIGGGELIDVLLALGQEDLIGSYEPLPELEGNVARGLPPYRAPATLLEAANLITNTNYRNHDALFRFLDVLNNEPEETFVKEIEKVLNVDQVLRFFAASAVMVHLDSYIGVANNLYIYEVNGKFTIIPWDVNMTFGTFNCGLEREKLVNYYIDEPTPSRMSMLPLVNRLLSHSPYLETYRKYVQEMIDGPFKPENLLKRIDDMSALIQPYLEADDEKFYATEDCIRCLEEDLRPPDRFIGWQAGGAVPMMPVPNALEMACLKRHFDVFSLWDFYTRELPPEDLEIIGNCLSEKNFSQFKQAIFGPLESPQPPGQPGFGPNSHGLKPFVVDRYHSVKDQLAGLRPSGSGYGLGNGVTTGICAGGF